MIKASFLICFLIISATTGTFAQDNLVIDPADSTFRARYEQVQFGTRFSMQVLSNDGKNYFLVDFSKIPSRFERVYFMTIAFKQDKIVNIDPEITRDRIWFFAWSLYPVREIEQLFLSLLEQSKSADKQFSEEMKKEWLSKNDKYK